VVQELIALLHSLELQLRAAAAKHKIQAARFPAETEVARVVFRRDQFRTKGVILFLVAQLAETELERVADDIRQRTLVDYWLL
jgi:hypothetical protein